MCDEADIETQITNDRARRGLPPLTDAELRIPYEPEAVKQRREARETKPVDGWFFQWCSACQAKRAVAPSDVKPFTCWCCGKELDEP